MTTPYFRSGATPCTSINYYDQANQLKPMRAEGLVGLLLPDVLRPLDKIFQAFFARVRRGEKPGFPRFRSFRRYGSITFSSYADGCRLLEDGKLRIQGAEDNHVDNVNDALVYYIALKRAGVPVEMHLYSQGGHAFGLRRTNLAITVARGLSWWRRDHSAT